MTSIDRTAYPRFQRTMSAREIVDLFTPSAEEVEWARDKTTAAPNMLALVVWLKSFQYLGYFPGPDEVPESVLKHIRGALGFSVAPFARIPVPPLQHMQDALRRVYAMVATVW